jgi:DNA-binding transcriptional LysR family regulator
MRMRHLYGRGIHRSNSNFVSPTSKILINHPAMTPDPRYLHTFHVVCQEGSFARAAARLHRTQPAVSHQIHALEQDFGAALFERSGRRAVLTAAGRQLREFCRRYFAELGALQTHAAAGGAEAAEPLRIAAVSGFGRYVLYPVLRAEPFARLPLELRFRTATEVLGLVEGGQCDLGVVYLPRPSNYLSFHPLYDEELALVVAAGSPDLALARLEQFEALPFVTYTEGEYVFGRWFDSVFGEQPRTTVSARHFDELEEVLDAVALGVGASIVPLDAAAPAIAAGRLRAVRPVAERRCLNRVYRVTRPGAYLRPELWQVVETVTALAPVRSG